MRLIVWHGCFTMHYNIEFGCYDNDEVKYRFDVDIDETWLDKYFISMYNTIMFQYEQLKDTIKTMKNQR